MVSQATGQQLLFLDALIPDSTTLPLGSSPRRAGTRFLGVGLVEGMQDVQGRDMFHRFPCMQFWDTSLPFKSDIGVLRLSRVQNLLDHVFLLTLYGYRWRGRSSALWEGILDEKFQEGDVEHG